MAFVIMCNYQSSSNDGRGGYSEPKSTVCGILDSDNEANAKALVKALGQRFGANSGAGNWGNHSPKFSYADVPVRSSSDGLALLEDIGTFVETLFQPA